MALRKGENFQGGQCSLAHQRRQDLPSRTSCAHRYAQRSLGRASETQSIVSSRSDVRVAQVICALSPARLPVAKPPAKKVKATAPKVKVTKKA